MTTTTRTFWAALFATLILIASAKAQSDSNPPGISNPSDFGLLGHPYLSIDGKLVQIRDVSFPTPHAYGTDTKLNFGLTDNLDFGFNYDLTHAKNCYLHLTDQVTKLYTTGYYKFGKFSPYVTAGAGYGWERSKIAFGTPKESERYDRCVYDLGTGVELPLVTDTSVCLGLDYGQGLRNPHLADVTCQAALNYNFEDWFGMGAGVDYQEGMKGSRNAIVYHLGVRFTFD